MNGKFFNFAIALSLVFVLFGADVKPVQAALPNPGAVLPIPVGKTAKYSQGPHLSGFRMSYITNKGQKKSSIDLGYSGAVVAPITGKLIIKKTCGDHQIVFIDAASGSDGYGWSIGLTHVWVDPSLNNTTVTQGKAIGKTVPPPANPGYGCGYGSGSHIHYTLMKWKAAGSGRLYTEQGISNTYIAQWIVKDTYLDGSYNDISVGRMIEDRVKITSVRSGKVIDAWSAGIQIWSYTSTNDNQKWIRIVAPNDSGYYFLKSVSRGKCMAAPDNSSGTLITFSTCGTENQKFKFVPVPGFPGKVAIQSKTSGKVLDVITDWNDPNSGKANGTRIQQWDPFYGNNQQWVFSKP